MNSHQRTCSLVVLLLAMALLSTIGSAAYADVGFPIETDWGKIVARPRQLELQVAKIPTNRVVTVPRLNNPIGLVHLKDDAEKRPLKFKPGTTSWDITIPKSAGNEPLAIILETKGDVYLSSRPRVVKQAADASITLHAHDAVTHGKLLRYEPQPHKNTVGYWANADDWCQWQFHVAAPRDFDVFVLQGCGKGQGGSQVALTVGSQVVKFSVEDTGHFQNFKERKVGSITIANTGDFSLKLKPIKKAAKAVMDVRRVRLVPAAE